MKRRDFLATSSVSLAALAVSDAGLNNVIAGEAGQRWAGIVLAA